MDSEVPKSLSERGAWYVVIQAMLIGLILFGPGGYQFPLSQEALIMLNAIGIAIGLLSLIIMLTSVIQLGKNLTPLPYPKEGAQLVQSGLYQFVRHPIYFGVILASIAWLLVFPGIFTLVYVICLFGLFDIKAKAEEVWLVKRFPAYVAYQASVKKLVPYVY